MNTNPEYVTGFFHCAEVVPPARGPDCPKCGKPTDERGRCWACKDWVCACGKCTGSPLISVCMRCQLDGEEAERLRAKT